MLGEFKKQRLKVDKDRKLADSEFKKELIIKSKEINTLKKESNALKIALDKTKLDRIRAVDTIKRSDSEARADQDAQEERFQEYKQAKAKEIADLKILTTNLRKELEQTIIAKESPKTPKTILSFAEKPQKAKLFKTAKPKNQTKNSPIDETDINKATAGDMHLDSSTVISPTDIVTSKLFNWVKAWQERNVPLYLSFYSKRFRDPKKSYSKWETGRRKSIEKALGISIKLSNIKALVLKKNTIKISFVQRYKSNKFSDIGIKELIWEKDKKSWKITKETWKPR